MRTLGAKDLRQRKRRSDKGKRRKYYNGKKVKKRKRIITSPLFRPYVSKRKPNDPIRLRFQEIKDMSYSGYKKWNPKMRKKLDKKVRPFITGVVFVEPQDIDNKEKLENFCIDVIQYAGTFNILMPSGRKNAFGVSYCKKAVIKITESEGLLNARLSNYSKLKHYGWFWNE